MSGLLALREKLQKAEENKKLTEDITDHTGWLKKIDDLGNKPEDWLEYTRYAQQHVHFVDKTKRSAYLLRIYDKALKAMPITDHKKNEAYAQILLDFAELKKEIHPAEAQVLYNHARTNLKTLAVVHVAAAQFELSQGNSSKCKKILEKAKEMNAAPSELLDIAITNLLNNKDTLLREDYSNSVVSVSNGMPVSAQTRGSQSDCDSGSEHTDGLNRGYLLSVSSTGPSPLQLNNSGGNISATNLLHTHSVDGTVSFKGQAQRPRGSMSSSSDDADTVPLVFDPAKGAFKAPGSLLFPPSASKPPLRTCHSTPDCKTAGPVFGTSARKRNANLRGKPMRVKRTSMPLLRETQTNVDFDEDEEDDDIFKQMKPLSAAGVDTSDSGIVTHNLTIPLEETPMDTNTPQPPAHHDHVPMELGTPDVAPPRFRLGPNSQPFQRKPSGLAGPAPVMKMPTHATSELEPPAVKQNTMPSTPSFNFKVAPPPAQTAPMVGHTPSHHGTQGFPHQLSTPHQQSIAATPSGQHVFAQQPSLGGSGAPPIMTPVVKPNEILTVAGQVYTILKVVGKGGSSKVYKVIDHDKNILAIKYVDLEGADQMTLESYRNEITLLKRLQYSDKVVKMYDYEYNQQENSLYVVMECGDTDLATLLRTRSKRGEITPYLTKFYWEEMLKSVQVLHKEGIIHSDLKPANFLLVAGNLKLIDFGIANAIQQDKTSVIRDTQVGTLNFMSPEAIMDTCGGSQVDEHGKIKPRIKLGVKSDVWSLGCILYNMVYARTPFQQITHQLGKLQAIVNPNYPIEFPNLDDKHLLEVMKRCLVRDPKARPSIEELLQHPYLQTEVQTKQVDSTGEHLSKIIAQLSAADVSSPRSASAISLTKGLLEQMQSGGELNLDQLLGMKRASGSDRKGGSPPGPTPPPPPCPMELRAANLGSKPPVQKQVQQVKNMSRAPLQMLNLQDIQKAQSSLKPLAQSSSEKYMIKNNGQEKENPSNLANVLKKKLAAKYQQAAPKNVTQEVSFEQSWTDGTCR